MPLAQLLYPPPTDDGLATWLHDNLRHHEALIQAINTKFGTSLTIATPIWPLNPKDETQLAIFNRAHQFLHNEMAQVLGIQNQDVSDLKFTEKRDLDAFMFIHFQEHQAAAQACGMPV